MPNRFRHEQPAPEADCEALLATIARDYPKFFPPALLDEIRQLLREHSPRRVGWALQEAEIQLVQENHSGIACLGFGRGQGTDALIALGEGFIGLMPPAPLLKRHPYRAAA